MNSTGEVPEHVQTDIDTAWQIELRRRIEDIQAGRVQMLDAEAIEDEILAELETMLHRVTYPDSR